MKSILLAAAATLIAATAAHAQFVPAGEPSKAEQRMPEQYWSAKPTVLTPYVAPNKVHWIYKDVLASHKGQSDWVQPAVRVPEQEGDYISLGAGKATKSKMYADDRIVFVVLDGEMEVTIDGVAPFKATKGFMVTVPFRHFYTLKNTGTVPAVRFEVRHANMVPLYPTSVTPDPYPGKTYVRVTGNPGPAKIGTAPDSNPIYVDFLKDVVAANAKTAKFVWDDNFTSNILRGPAQKEVPPDTNKGHFHVDWTEFWLIMEGKVGYKIEGFPYFTSEFGDVVAAAQGRFHRPGNDPSAPMSTRIPFNPRPIILHNFEPAPPAP